MRGLAETLSRCAVGMALLVATEVAQTQPGTDQPSIELQVAVAGEFAPIDWQVRVSAGASELTIQGNPSLWVQVWQDRGFRGYGDLRSGDERGLGGRPCKPDLPCGLGNTRTSRVAVGEVAVWRGQFAEWRCCGIPGRYRIRAVVAQIDSAGQPRLTLGGWTAATKALASDWVEFTIEPSNLESLQRSRIADGSEWGSYRSFMDREFAIGEVMTGADAARFITLVDQMTGVPVRDAVAALRNIQGLPPRLCARLDLHDALRELLLGIAAPTADERTLRLARAGGLARSARGEGGAFPDAVGGLIELRAFELRGDTATAAAMRAGLRNQASCMEVLRASPEVVAWLEGRPQIPGSLGPGR